MNKYSICSINYNMEETVEESLRAILNQIDDRFEVVVFDESDDGSYKIMRNLEKEYNKLRVFHREKAEGRRLGRARNTSVKKAKGDDVLLHLDMDDKYKEGTIKDFTRIYEKLGENVNHPFYFRGSGINIVQKDWFLNEVGGYRNIGRGEDKELWRRLIQKDRIICLKNELPYKKIGYHRDLWERYKVVYKGLKSAFEWGETLLSNLKWYLLQRGWKCIFFIPMIFIAYFSTGERKEVNSRFKDRLYFMRKIKELKKTLPELEQEYGFKVKREKLNCGGVWLK